MCHLLDLMIHKNLLQIIEEWFAAGPIRTDSP